MASFFDLINKLIVEHGSAVSQEKLITLLKYEATLLDKQKLAVDAENIILREENESLKAKNSVLEKKNIELKEKLKSKDQSFHDNLPDEQRRILAMLSNSGMNESKIIETMDKRDEAVRYDIEELRIAGLIEIDTMAGFAFISLTHDGRKYLKKINVI